MTRSVFYASNSFEAKQVMLSAALREAEKTWAAFTNPGSVKAISQPLDQEYADFLTRAFSKAISYSSARNSLAHPLFTQDDQSREMRLTGRGKWWSSSGLDITHLQEIEARFKSLKVILQDVYVHVCAPAKTLPKMTLQEGLRQLGELPNAAHPSLATHSSSGHSSQPQPFPKKARKPRLSSAEKRKRAFQPKGDPSL